MRTPHRLASAMLAISLLTATAAPAVAHDAEDVLELHIEDLEAFAYTLALNGGVLTSAMVLELITSLEANAALYTPPPTQTTRRSPALSNPTDVEAWRSLVATYFAAGDVDKALTVIGCESNGDPGAYNPSSGASGLFQHLPKYWAERTAASGYSGANIFDPGPNVAVAAWLLYSGGGWRHWPNCGRL